MNEIKKLFLGALILVAAVMCGSYSNADYPIPTYSTGQPVDSRHVTRHIVSVSTNAAVLMSANYDRMHSICQFTSEGANSLKLYWDVGSTVSSSSSTYVEVGDYFSPDDSGVAWQGNIRAVLSSSTGTVVCQEFEFPEN